MSPSGGAVRGGHSGRTAAVCVLVALAYAALAALQVVWFVGGRGTPGYFLFGTDTVSHDMPVALWLRLQAEAHPGAVPLWMPPLQGGLPVLGAFLATPFSPFSWLHGWLSYPHAQVLGWGAALWVAGMGGYAAGRAFQLPRLAAFGAGAAWMLTGHIVTLIHAGHWQKVMALAWLAWGLAGHWWSMRPRFANPPAGGGLAGCALGLMLLAGHPQIAAAHLMMGAGVVLARAMGARSPRLSALHAGVFCGAAALGLALGGAQFLPGAEMARVSNRAAGVSFEEAVQTSYPPAETFEFLVPRHIGSNTGSDRFYWGSWGAGPNGGGERIVSDYAGILFVLLACLGAVASRRHGAVRFLAAAALIALVVGFGRFTPLYALMYHAVPGFKSFRSPATFYCVTSLAVAMLTGFGLRAMLHRRGVPFVMLGAAIAAPLAASALAIGLRVHRWPPGLPDDQLLRIIYHTCFALLALFAARTLRGRGRRVPGRLLAAALLVVPGAFDLLTANRAFLVAQPFAAYQGDFGSEQTDALYLALPKPWRASFIGRELSLRPILIDAESLTGYHPISFAAKEASDRTLTLHSIEWRRLWGVGLEVRPRAAGGGRSALGEGAAPYQQFRENSPVRLLEPGGGYTTRDLQWQWTLRGTGPMELKVRAPRAGTLEVADVVAPGWRTELGGRVVSEAREVALSRQVEIPAGESVVRWVYEPASYRVGVFLTAAGLLVGLFLLVAGTARPRPT